MSSVEDVLLTAWTTGRKTKRTPSGWISANAVCCEHNGESPDTRGRGGVITDGNRISYSCFNCGFKASWQPGWHLSHKMRRLLKWLGVPEDEIGRLVIEAMRQREFIDALEFSREEEPIEFKTIDQPADWKPITDLTGDLGSYLKQRSISPHGLFWSDKRMPYNMNKRFIIPFYYEGDLVGYTARAFYDSVKPKYIANVPQGYVYGLDQQQGRDFVLVFDGVLDARVMGGLAVMKSDINDTQIELIERLGKRVILVPDNDRTAQRLIDTALDLGWGVSFPEWHDTCKDAAKAVEQYGKLFTFLSILQNTELSTMRIKIKRKGIG